MINMKHITAYFTVMEWLGSDCQAAQLNRFLEPVWDLQSLQLVIGMTSQFICTKSFTLLCQGQ